MFKILNGREHFYQWDLNQKLVVEDASVNEVHFCTRACSEALVVEVKEEDGARIAEVPNILLQKAFDLKAYAYTGEEYTKHCETFEVVSRTKPSEYIYTETEVKRYEDLMSYTRKRYYIPYGSSAFIGLARVGTRCSLLMIIFARSNDETYKIDIPFNYDLNPTGLDISNITNLEDFKPMIKNELLGSGVYSFEHINKMVEGYYSECKYGYATQNTDDGILALFLNEYRFSSEAVATAFYNEFQPALEQTEYLILEYTKPEQVIVNSYDAIAPLEVM